MCALMQVGRDSLSPMFSVESFCRKGAACGEPGRTGNRLFSKSGLSAKFFHQSSVIGVINA